MLTTFRLFAAMTVMFSCISHATQLRGELLAGTGRTDITEQSVAFNDPLYAKALVLRSNGQLAVLITVDAVSIGRIGHIRDTYLQEVRDALQEQFRIPPEAVFVNASHCHGVVCKDVAERTVEAVGRAMAGLVPVRAGTGVGQEVRIMENRRLLLKDGSETDVRRAYSMPWDDEVAEIGPVDPEIGLLRLDRTDGTPLAVIYNFACHPIHGVPSGLSSADFPGFASAVVEENLGHDCLAFFIQGCAGDINPVIYKDVTSPHDCEPFGNMLGLNVLRGLRTIPADKMDDSPEVMIISEQLPLPRAADFEARLQSLEQQQEKLLSQLGGTDLNFRSFLPLYLQHKLNPEYPAYYAPGYLLEERNGVNGLRKLDEVNARNLDAYLRNIRTMEKLSRLQVNRRLLQMHQKQTIAAEGKPLTVEVGGIRIGDFRLITFPGELTVQIGLNIKQKSPHRFTFVAGYTNGYIYYTPTSKQRLNSGFAQEDCDTLVAPEWQPLFEKTVADLLSRL